MGAHQIARRDRRLEQAAMAGRERAMEIAAVRDHPGLIEARPLPNAAVQLAEQDLAIIGEPVGNVGIEPSAAIVERGREVPVIERQHRLDALLEQRVHQALVEIEAGAVHPARALGEDSGPGRTEAIGCQAELAHQGDVRAEPAVVVARDVAGIPAVDAARRAHEAVPDAGAGAESGSQRAASTSRATTVESVFDRPTRHRARSRGTTRIASASRSVPTTRGPSLLRPWQELPTGGNDPDVSESPLHLSVQEPAKAPPAGLRATAARINTAKVRKASALLSIRPASWIHIAIRPLHPLRSIITTVLASLAPIRAWAASRPVRRSAAMISCN